MQTSIEQKTKEFDTKRNYAMSKVIESDTERLFTEKMNREKITVPESLIEMHKKAKSQIKKISDVDTDTLIDILSYCQFNEKFLKRTVFKQHQDISEITIRIILSTFRRFYLKNTLKYRSMSKKDYERLLRVFYGSKECIEIPSKENKCRTISKKVTAPRLTKADKIEIMQQEARPVMITIPEVKQMRTVMLISGPKIRTFDDLAVAKGYKQCLEDRGDKVDLYYVEKIEGE